MTYTLSCEKCREKIFHGEEVLDDYMEIYGDYEPGCGECENCGKNLCADCGDFDGESVCSECRNKTESEEEES